MTDAVLYRNSAGKDVTHSSYSSRQTFKHCPRDFQLTRVQGWSDRVNRAATHFGRCIESGIQAFEENDRRANSGAHKFVVMWNEVKLLPEFPTLVYTGAEKSWDNLLEIGQQMMYLYAVRASKLPITRPLFQQILRKKIFPGTNLDKLENKAILDILSFPVWNHPMLQKLDVKPDDDYRSLIIDVKTSGKDFPTELVALDPQLAEYAWQARIPDVAFLWFVKKSQELKVGSRIALLEFVDEKHWAGWEGFVLETVVMGPENEKGDAPETGAWIASYDVLEVYEKSIKGLTGNKRIAAKKALLDGGVESGNMVYVNTSCLTKQRIQFATARLTEQNMDDVGRTVAQTTVEMVRAHEQDFYEQLPGIRFPNEKCGFCSMKWICLNRPDERDKNLTRRGEEWLDGIQDEGNE